MTLQQSLQWIFYRKWKDVWFRWCLDRHDRKLRSLSKRPFKVKAGITYTPTKSQKAAHKRTMKRRAKAIHRLTHPNCRYCGK